MLPSFRCKTLDKRPSTEHSTFRVTTMTFKHAGEEELVSADGTDEIESVEAPAPPTPEGEDLVHLYFREIGKTRLLTSQQETDIGRRIESGQMDARRALCAIPLAFRELLDIGEKLRLKELSGDDVIVLPEGGEVDAKTVRTLLLAFARLRRLYRQIEQLERWHGRRRHGTGNRQLAAAIARKRAALEDIVTELPLKTALIDRLV